MSLIMGSSFFGAPPEIITENGVFDYDADLGLTLEDTDRVINWADQLVNVGDLFRSTGSSRRPTLITNGNPSGDGDAIEFDGADDGLIVSGGFTWNQPETIYLVLKALVWNANDYFFDGNAANVMAGFQNGTTPTIKMRAGVATVADNSDLAVNAWAILCFVFNGASSSIRVNNNTKTTGSPGTSNASGPLIRITLYIFKSGSRPTGSISSI